MGIKIQIRKSSLFFTRSLKNVYTNEAAVGTKEKFGLKGSSFKIYFSKINFKNNTERKNLERFPATATKNINVE